MPTVSKKVKQLLKKASKKRTDFLDRRPHRSFRRTRRRDYARTLELPGYIHFTGIVTKTMWEHRKSLLCLLVIYVALYALLVGVVSQSAYSTLTETLQGVGGDILEGEWGNVGTALILLVSLVSPESASNSGDAPQIFAIILSAMAWLSIVWYLRNRLAGHNVNVRDALYSSGGPLFATIVIIAFIAVQLLPVVLAIIGFAAASSSGLLDSGIAAMLAWFALGGLALLSLYWIVSSVFAMVIVTLPGTYPYKALKVAGDIVTGRRARLVMRWSYMGIVAILAWVLVMVPMILLDMWLGSIWEFYKNIPFIPILLVVMSAATLMWSTVYVYLLYRRVVDSAA